VNKSSTIDIKEVEKFSALADEWWDESGKFKPLHQINPIRISFIRQQILKHFTLEEEGLKDLTILDVGCGGGLLSVPLSRQGADVLGIDVSEKNISIVNAYKDKHDLGDNINFAFTSVEELALSGKSFDVVCAMEVVEHVADVELFIKSCLKVVKPGGLIFLATINRTAKSYLLAILGAEYVLRWVPVGTHDWNKFVKPSELLAILNNENAQLLDIKGLGFLPLSGKWQISDNIDVNYMLAAKVS
jgi:2-polyprenyl-6-hydroxyphenyl methylase/3-demethylubiquinone-9 3-methyltransferase